MEKPKRLDKQMEEFSQLHNSNLYDSDMANNESSGLIDESDGKTYAEKNSVDVPGNPSVHSIIDPKERKGKNQDALGALPEDDDDTAKWLADAEAELREQDKKDAA